MVNAYLILLFAQFIIGFFIVQYNGGLIKNIYFSFCMILYFFYYFVSCYALWSIKEFEILGISIETIFPKGLIVYNLGIFFFILGYLSKSAIQPKSYFKKLIVFDDKWLVRLTIFFLVINYFFRFYGVSVEGSWGNYLWLTQDFLIILVISLYSRKLNIYFFYFSLGSSIFLFSLNFFRYRIYLTLIGIGVIYITKNPEILKKIGRYLVISVAFFYLLLFFTINRLNLANNNLNKVRFNVFENTNDIKALLLSEGSDVHADFNILKYYKEHNNYPHDFGQTIFIFPFIRALPSNLFKGSIKPYPPSLKAIIDAYGGDQTALHSGKAVTNLIEFYIAFGLPGVIVLMFFFGFILRILQNHWLMDGSYNELIQIATLISLFQYITRGYFPQYINHILYLISPIYIIRRFSKNNVIQNLMPVENYRNQKNIKVPII